MYKYLAFFKIAFKNAFAYKISVFMNLFGTIVSIIAQLALWFFVFKNDSEMMNYMMLYVIISKILGVFYMNNITESLGNKIISGDFIIDLIKPINLIFTLWSSSLGMVSATLINQCSLLIAIFMPMLIKLDVTLLSLVVFIIVSILGLILSSILYVLIGYLAFLVIEIWPYKRLLDDTIRFLSGSIIPIAFFPDILKKIIMFFPFHFMYSFPIKILLENITPNEIITNLAKMILWICILLLFLWKIYKNSVRHCIVQGG